MLNLDIPDNVEFVAHAVAKDEHRDLFPLTSIANHYGEGDSFVNLIPGVDFRKKYQKKDYKVLRGDRFWEQPFEGTHSSIGGGDEDGTNLSALYWMALNGKAHGAPFDISRFEGSKVFKDGTRKEYKMKTGDWDDTRVPWIDRIPFTSWGPKWRNINSGNLVVIGE
jgi:hypothetical protein